MRQSGVDGQQNSNKSHFQVCKSKNNHKQIVPVRLLTSIGPPYAWYRKGLSSVCRVRCANGHSFDRLHVWADEWWTILYPIRRCWTATVHIQWWWAIEMLANVCPMTNGWITFAPRMALYLIDRRDSSGNFFKQKKKLRERLCYFVFSLITFQYFSIFRFFWV